MRKTSRGKKAQMRRRRGSAAKVSNSRGRTRSTLTGQSAKRRAIAALHRMRSGKSLTTSARRSRTTRATVHKYAKRAIVRTTAGQYKPTAYDRLPREMRFLTPEGLVAVRTRSSAQASAVGRYWNAVDRYLRTGNVDVLSPFRERTIRVGRKYVQFVTDPVTLERLAHAGEVRFEDLYPNSN